MLKNCTFSPYVNPFRTAIPFWGQTTLISSSLSPKRDCGSKGVKDYPGLGNRSIIYPHSSVGNTFTFGGCPGHLRTLFGKTPSGRHRKSGRTHWSRSGRDPCSGARGGRSNFFPAGIDKTSSLVSGLILYVRTGEILSYFCPLMSVASTYRYRHFAFEHSTDNKQYSSKAESVLTPSCLQHYNPAVLQQQHSGRVSTVLLWLVAFI